MTFTSGVVCVSFLLILCKLAQLAQVDLLGCRLLGSLLVFEIRGRPEYILNVLQFSGSFIALFSSNLATRISQIVRLKSAVLVLDLFGVVRLHDR